MSTNMQSRIATERKQKRNRLAPEMSLHRSPRATRKREDASSRAKGPEPAFIAAR